MKVINIETKKEFFIDLFKSSGEERRTCPECSPTRKKKHDKCYSWNHEKQTGYCSHCNITHVLYQEKKKEYVKPAWKNNTELSNSVVKWFETRGIKQFTLRQMKVSEGLEFMPQEKKQVNTIQFNYFRNDELVNVKYRDGKKNFKLHSGSEMILYNYDNVKGQDEIVIVEGEMDVLALYECGVRNVCSVPNGAGASNKLDFLDNCIELFGEETTIVLATDADLPGMKLRNELSTRLGIENCKRVDFKDCKDANEYLLKYGAPVLFELIENAKPFPVEGIFSANDFRDDINDLYENGLKPAMQIGFRDFDNLISFDYNRLYTFTGIPGHGKSEVVDQIVVKLNTIHNLKVAYFSPENFPLKLHTSKIIEKLSGKRFNKQALSKVELEECIDYYADNYFHISPEDNFTVDSILSRAKHLVKTKGIKILVIDPYNTLEHQNNGNEHEYVSKFLDILRNFAKRNGIMIFLVAHPTKMPKMANGQYEIPTMYNVSGSSNFYNKTDFGVCVYRNFISGLTEVYIQKVKFKHLGEVGCCNFTWNKDNGRYSEFDSINEKWIIDNKSYLRKEEQDVISNYEPEPNKDFWDDLKQEKAIF